MRDADRHAARRQAFDEVTETLERQRQAYAEASAAAECEFVLIVAGLLALAGLVVLI